MIIGKNYDYLFYNLSILERNVRGYRLDERKLQ